MAGYRNGFVPFVHTDFYHGVILPNNEKGEACRHKFSKDAPLFASSILLLSVFSPVIAKITQGSSSESDNSFETGWAKHNSSYFQEETPTAPAQTALASILVKEAVKSSHMLIKKSTLPQSNQVLNATGGILMAHGVCSVWGETIAHIGDTPRD